MRSTGGGWYIGLRIGALVLKTGPAFVAGGSLVVFAAGFPKMLGIGAAKGR
jgi:hypothetical protein